jgi:hypothetical protein
MTHKKVLESTGLAEPRIDIVERALARIAEFITAGTGGSRPSKATNSLSLAAARSSGNLPGRRRYRLRGGTHSAENMRKIP